jgi:hypothetical protein
VWALRAFFFIIIVNAAVVFASPRTRIGGAVLTLILLLTWAARSKRDRAPSLG